MVAQKRIDTNGLEVVGEEVLVPWKDIRRCPTQPRVHFDEDKLHRLALSIKRIGQKKPVLIKHTGDTKGPRFELVDGERRWRAVQIAEIATLRAIVRPVETDEEQFTDSVVANFTHEPHTTMEVARACERLRGFGRTLEEIAEILGYSVPSISLYLKLLRLAPEAQELLEPTTPDERRIPMQVALGLANLAADAQREVIVQGCALEGLLRKHLPRLIKQAVDGGAQLHQDFQPRTPRPSDVRKKIERIVLRMQDDLEELVGLNVAAVCAGARDDQARAIAASFRVLNTNIAEMCARLQ